MLAVFAPLDRGGGVRPASTGSTWSSPTRTRPRQCVLSGPTAEIERAAGLFADRGDHGPAARRLGGVPQPVRRRARGPRSARALDAVDLTPGTIPVFANTTGEPYPDDADAAPRPAGRASSPGRSSSSPRSRRCTGRARGRSSKSAPTRSSRAWSGRSSKDASTSRSRSTRRATVRARRTSPTWPRALANLAALGYPVELARWDDGYRDAASPSTAQGPDREGLRRQSAAAAASRPTPSPTAVGGASTGRDSSPRPDSHGRPADSIDTVQHRADHERLPSRTIDPPSNGHASDGPSPSLLARPLAGRCRAAIAGHAGRRSRPRTWPRRCDQTQENLVALQRLAEQTAQLHRQFLEGQDEHPADASSRCSSSSSGWRWPSLGRRAPPPEAEPRTLAPARAGAPVAPSAPAPDAAAKRRSRRPGQPRSRRPPTRADARSRRPIPRRTGVAAEILLEVVAEKTGYPAEMLELDMQLDADLGIDSIKRVEILSALQDRLPEAAGGQARAPRHAPHPPPDRRVPRRRRRRPLRRPRRVERPRRGRAARQRPHAGRRAATSAARAAGGGGGEDGLPGGDARAGHAARRRPGHRLDQAGGDPLGAAGPAARGARRSSPSSSARSAPSARSSTSSTGRRRTPPAPGRTATSGRAARRRTSRRPPCRLGRRSAEVLLEVVAEKTGYPGRDARAGHAARRRPGDRLDQAGGDPLGDAGPAARGAGGQARAARHAPHPPPDRRVPRRGRPAGSEPSGPPSAAGAPEPASRSMPIRQPVPACT